MRPRLQDQPELVVLCSTCQLTSGTKNLVGSFISVIVPIINVSGNEIGIISYLAFKDVIYVVLAIFGLWESADGCGEFCGCVVFSYSFAIFGTDFVGDTVGGLGSINNSGDERPLEDPAQGANGGLHRAQCLDYIF